MKKKKEGKVPLVVQVDESMMDNIKRIATSKGMGVPSYVRSVLYMEVHREIDLTKQKR